MYYVNLENESNIDKMSDATLRKWVKELYKKGKQISHSEQTHKHDSVFWKRAYKDNSTALEFSQQLYLIDESRKKFNERKK